MHYRQNAPLIIIDNQQLISVNWQRCQQGELVERLKAPVLKTGEGASPPWVQIHLSATICPKAPSCQVFWGFFVPYPLWSALLYGLTPDRHCSRLYAWPIPCNHRPD